MIEEGRLDDSLKVILGLSGMEGEDDEEELPCSLAPGHSRRGLTCLTTHSPTSSPGIVSYGPVLSRWRLTKTIDSL